MTKFWLNNPTIREVSPPASVSLADFVHVGECPQASLDRKLGYFGKSRYVLFYYEPRGGEVMWNDGRTYGFGSGGWLTFIDEIVPMARRHGADLGDGEKAGADALIIDRHLREIYFANRKRAEAFVEQQHERPQCQITLNCMNRPEADHHVPAGR